MSADPRAGKTSRDEPQSPFGNAERIKDSAQQIWLAGLGAFAKAQQEGAKAFEALVSDGLGVQKKAQAAAEEGVAQAQRKVTGMAEELGARAAGQWGKLESIFEQRVARALDDMGMPPAAEVAALQAQIDALTKRLDALERATGAGSAGDDPPAGASRSRRPRA
ncbi:MAG: poly(hydroxyalkanoate) granule-associated protein [Comamonadaceae bacterium]|nr:MAG: poly(hydroxyalkanoate) granule-associated protein [Comamonadaceae bacterium]